MELLKKVYLLSLLFICLSQAEFRHEEDVREKCFHDELVSPGDLRHTASSFIHTLAILSNVKFNQDNEVPSILKKFKLFSSSLLESSEGTPLHLIFITDESSKGHIKDVLMREIGRSISESIIRIPTADSFEQKPKRFPRLLKVEFVNIQDFSTNYRTEIDDMRKYFGVTFPDNYTQVGADGKTYHLVNNKYQKDLFYIAPFYPAMLPKEINVIVVVDIDLEFRTDLIELIEHYDHMSDSELIAVGPELLPHYFVMSKYYRKKHPDTKVGSPGKMQGFNTGVVVYDLEGLRQSDVFPSLLNPGYYKQLVDKYGFFGGVGDQDLLTMIGWEYPEMFYSLPCQFNLQTFRDPSMSRETADLLPTYSHCPHKPKIIHRNGSI